MASLCLALHYFKNSSVNQSPAAVKQRLLDEVAEARLQLAAATSDQSYLDSKPEHLFVYSGNHQVYWADNRTPVIDSLRSIGPGFVELQNGIYFLHKRQGEGDTSLLYLKLIQETPRVRNRYVEPYKMFRGVLSLVPMMGFTEIDLGQQKVYYSAIPSSLSSLELFNPGNYGSSKLNPSLGILLANLIFLTTLIFLLGEFRFGKKQQWRSLFSMMLLFVVGPLCSFTIISLVNDSKLNLEFFNFNSLSLIDLSVPAVLILYSVMIYRLYKMYAKDFSGKGNLLIIVSAIILYNFIAFLAGYYDLIEINWFIPLFFLPFIPAKKADTSLPWHAILVALTITFGWFFELNKHEYFHLRDEESLVLDKLAENHDPIAEYLINEAIPEIEKRYSSSSDSITDPTQYLEDNLFLGYLSRYTALKLPDSIPADVASSFFRFNNSNYQLQNRYNTAAFGFPELLANREFANYYEKGFSTSRYVNGKLYQSTGSYPYKKLLPEAYEKDGYIERKGHLHLVHNTGQEVIVVSYPVKGWLQNFATVAFLFFISLIGISPWLVKRTASAGSLQNRIRFTFLSLVVITVSIFGVSTYLYLSDQFAEKNKLSLSEKIRSVETELQNKLSEEPAKDKQTLENQLRKLAEIFFTDISIYDVNGKLIASSQPDIFTKGVLSTNMEPEAYRRMSRSGSNLFIQTESIGKLNYLSAYKPFSDTDNKTVAYINLPYFAKQLELNKQLSNFLVSTIAALVLLTAIALILAIVLSTRITEPLKTIRLKLQAIDLKNQNQQIDYPVADEIGELVAAYNSKVEELIVKANQLAQSERESAWREMAKQVAHEIKNPLTPIKLNAQLLQRNIDANDPNISEKTSRFIAGLIDQVNTLTKIANEFSNYASLPKTVESEVDLNLIVQNAVSVMSADHIAFDLKLSEEQSLVFADKDLLVRVVNNLLKNSIQAIEERHNDSANGKIKVALDKEQTVVALSITDNGIGISDDMRDKIFSPNFTTKSTGMGLGLAMVKQIIEQAGGKISFESHYGFGTTFTVILPLIQEHRS